ncbi:hypothetical protein RIR_jg31606.t2 [Rhizophagus irregularis DAOM 181602=DAOM 197198]|nr:hypothetical protein RIR_jg31606.t2 [Rhizophagus irregularis DAOM 181602=DAOM 197198]
MIYKVFAAIKFRFASKLQKNVFTIYSFGSSSWCWIGFGFSSWALDRFSSDSWALDSNLYVKRIFIGLQMLEKIVGFSD